jgi:predicted esterase
MFEGEKISGLDERILLATAQELVEKGQWASAAQFQYWVVKRSGRHQYDLACDLAQSGQKESAFYWLQAAALEDGVDADWAQRDADLASLRADPRWAQVSKFLRQCGEYWGSQDILKTAVYLPKNYDGKTPIVTIVGLHGLGSDPQNMFGDLVQKFADKLNVAFVGVSGTIPRGKSSFVWSEQPETDHRHIVKALDSLADRMQVKPGHVIAIGFSQGAQASLEAAVRYPEFYAGAIVLSPGNREGSKLANVQPSPELANRGFVFVVGAGEHPGNVQLTAQDALWARRAGAKVIHRPTIAQTQHTFPGDFENCLPEWIKFINEAAGR